MLELELPFPPSINHYYRRVGPRTLISRKGHRYRNRVCGILNALSLERLEGPLAMELDLYPPNRQRRDLDNVQKSLWDALAHGGVYRDDSQIKEFTCHMREPLPPNGKAVARIRQQ